MSKAKPIPMKEPISFEDWKAGLEDRRRICAQVAPLGAGRRLEGSDDRRLRAAFGGKRAPSAEDLAAPLNATPAEPAPPGT